MIHEFQKFGDRWNTKLNDLKIEAERMVEQKGWVPIYLHDVKNDM